MKITGIDFSGLSTKSAAQNLRKHQKIEEIILLKHLSQGDSSAFWKLWIPHRNYLYCRCLAWMNGNVADAEDLLSQATLKAWKKLPDHANKIINLRAWLTRFTHNLCVDIQRKNSKRAIGVDSFEEIAGQLGAVQAIAESPDSVMLRNELDKDIRTIINRLPLRLQATTFMRFQQDMSYVEIAQQLDISIDNVYKRISQARKLLKPLLIQHFLEEELTTVHRKHTIIHLPVHTLPLEQQIEQQNIT